MRTYNDYDDFSLNQYFRSINAINLLTPEEEVELAKRNVLV